MAEVVLDANVLVALLYDADVHHARARALASKLEAAGHALVLLDIVVYEACRCCVVVHANARQPLRTWRQRSAKYARGSTAATSDFVADEATRLVRDVLDIVRETSGRLNFNDALLVALHREGLYDALATLDPGFDGVAGFAVFA